MSCLLRFLRNMFMKTEEDFAIKAQGTIQNSLHTTGRTIIKSAGLNVVGKIIPVAIGIFLIPFIIPRLGNEQFGILSIVWVSLTNYFYLFDFGLGQTVTKFISESVERQDRRHLSELIWTSLIVNFIFSFFLLIILLPLVPFIVNNILKISPEFRIVAQTSFFILVFSFPLTTTFSVVRGILEGIRRYDLLNLVKIPFNSFLFIIPAVSLIFGFKLIPIVLLLAVSQVFAIIAGLFLVVKTLPFVKKSFLVSAKTAKKIFNFGKWITVANLVNAFLVTSDRLFIGALISVGSIGFYSVPFDAVANILTPAQSLIVLFPVFSALNISRKNEAAFFYMRIFKHLLAIMGIAVIFILVYSGEILNFWLGAEFAEKSTLVLQFLSIGMIGICFSAVGDNLIKGYGKPELLVKIRLAEAIPFFASLIFFTLKFGIAGTAFVWMVRAVLDALIIIFANLKLLSLKFPEFLGSGIGRAICAVLIFGAAMLIGKIFMNPLFFMFFVILLIIVFLYVWLRYILDSKDKNFIKFLLIKSNNAGA